MPSSGVSDAVPAKLGVTVTRRAFLRPSLSVSRNEQSPATVAERDSRFLPTRIASFTLPSLQPAADTPVGSTTFPRSLKR